MLAYLEGTIKSIHNDYIILLTHGVGYKVHIGMNKSQMMPLDSNIELYIETIVREDSITLYGFTHYQEQELFITLLSVQGVGAKMSQAIIDTLSYQQTIIAIMGGYHTELCQVSGVGKKLAGRIIQELSEKIGKLQHQHHIPNGEPNIMPQNLSNQHLSSLINALTSLGYSPSESQKVASHVIAEHPDHTLEALIPIALQKILILCCGDRNQW